MWMSTLLSYWHFTYICDIAETPLARARAKIDKWRQIAMKHRRAAARYRKMGEKKRIKEAKKFSTSEEFISMKLNPVAFNFVMSQGSSTKSSEVVASQYRIKYLL